MTYVHPFNPSDTCAGPEEGGGGAQGPDPTEKIQKLGFLSNTGPDPLKITKLPSQHSMLGHQRHATETPFKLRFTDGPVMARLRGILIISPLIQEKKLSGSAHDVNRVHMHSKDRAEELKTVREGYQNVLHV